MTDHEKLAELIREAKQQWEGGTANIDDRIADHLIANGVTIQRGIPREPDENGEWISLPGETPQHKNKVWVAVLDKNFTRHVCRGSWDFYLGWNLDLNGVKVIRVTHWKAKLPLPKLPPLDIKEVV